PLASRALTRPSSSCTASPMALSPAMRAPPLRVWRARSTSPTGSVSSPFCQPSKPVSSCSSSSVASAENKSVISSSRPCAGPCPDEAASGGAGGTCCQDGTVAAGAAAAGSGAAGGCGASASDTSISGSGSSTSAGGGAGAKTIGSAAGSMTGSATGSGVNSMTGPGAVGATVSNAGAAGSCGGAGGSAAGGRVQEAGASSTISGAAGGCRRGGSGGDGGQRGCGVQRAAALQVADHVVQLVQADAERRVQAGGAQIAFEQGLELVRDAADGVGPGGARAALEGVQGALELVRRLAVARIALPGLEVVLHRLQQLLGLGGEDFQQLGVDRGRRRRHRLECLRRLHRGGRLRLGRRGV